MTTELDNTKIHHRWRLSYITVFAAIGFGIAGTWIAPKGVIDPSMLYLIAQLLIYSAILMGLGNAVAKVTDLLNGFRKDINKEIESNSNKKA